MKIYKSVVAELEKENYKQGVNRLDINSGYYKVSKRLNLLSTIWIMLFQFGLIFGGTTSLLIYTKNAPNVDMPLYIVTCIAFVIFPISLYLIKRNLSYIALVLNVAAVYAQLTRLYYNDIETVNEFLNNGYLNNVRFWMYFVPGFLICIFTLVICLITIKTRWHFTKDYKAVLEKMYDAYREENPAVSDIEWTEHLENLEKEFIEKTAAEKEIKLGKEKKKKDIK